MHISCERRPKMQTRSLPYDEFGVRSSSPGACCEYSASKVSASAGVAGQQVTPTDPPSTRPHPHLPLHAPHRPLQRLVPHLSIQPLVPQWARLTFGGDAVQPAASSARYRRRANSHSGRAGAVYTYSATFWCTPGYSGSQSRTSERCVVFEIELRELSEIHAWYIIPRSRTSTPESRDN